MVDGSQVPHDGPVIRAALFDFGGVILSSPFEAFATYEREAGLPADFIRCIRLIEEGKIDTAPWITHRTDFDGAVDDFASFTDPKAGVIKAMIDVV